jgi:hypothetical protein
VAFTDDMKQWIALKREKSELTVKLKKIGSDIGHLEEQIIDAMIDNDVKSIKVDGVTLFREIKTFVSVVKRENESTDDTYLRVARMLRKVGLGKMLLPRFKVATIRQWVTERVKSGQELPEGFEGAIKVHKEACLGHRPAVSNKTKKRKTNLETGKHAGQQRTGNRNQPGVDLDHQDSGNQEPRGSNPGNDVERREDLPVHQLQVHHQQTQNQQVRKPMAKKDEIATRTPAYLANVQDVGQVLGALAENFEGEQLDRFAFPKVTIPAGGGAAMTVPGPDGEEAETEIRGVIVYQHQSRAYWKGSMDDEAVGAGPPDCAADNGKWGQGNPGGECAKCPMAAFGSGKGGRGQACKLMRNVYFLMSGKSLPIVIQVPPTSLKSYKAYVFNLSTVNKVFYGVETIIGVSTGHKDKQGRPYSKFSFRSSRDMEGEELAKTASYAFEFKEALGVVTQPAEA